MNELISWQVFVFFLLFTNVAFILMVIKLLDDAKGEKDE